MKKTITAALLALGLISGLGAASDMAVQERSDFQQLSGPPKTELSSTPLSHTGTALEFVVSGGLLVGAAAVNSRGSKSTNLDIERVIFPRLVEGVESASVVRALNRSESGFRTLISYLCDQYQLHSPTTKINAIPDASPFMVSARIAVDNSDVHKAELLIEAIGELISEKVDQAQHIMVDRRMRFEDAFSEGVGEEVKMGKALFIQKLDAFRSRRH